MDTSAGGATVVVGVKTDSTRQSRLTASKSTIEKAKDVAKMAIDVLSVVAEATESVPYLGAISKALTAFKEVLDEVNVCKEDCRATINDANEFRELILKFEAKWVQLESGGEDELWKALLELGRSVLDCIETLQDLKVDSTRRRDRFKLIFKRDEVQSSINRCRDRMRAAKEKFNMRVALDTNHLVRELHQRSQPAIAPAGTTSAAEAVWRLRAANAIFYGREADVTAAVDLIVNKVPARVAILGPGGIGKTSIALAVLHHASVKALYGDQRCFTSCEATPTADTVVRALADALGFGIEDGVSPDASRHRLVSHLKTVSGIICLDNLETPLDTDKRAVEDLLNDITALPRVALLITSRDTSIPALKWTSPRLAYIKPFSQEAALATWDDICHGHDQYALNLVQAVDCMPLAATLLARLVAIEGSAKNIWARWVTERTDLIRTGSDEHRLFSVGASIELSLRSLNNHEEAVTVIGILCIFTIGLTDDETSVLSDALEDRLSFRRALTLLKQLSLIYTDEIDLVRMLSPIRHHIQQHHVSDELFVMLADVMTQDAQHWVYDEDWNDVLKFGFNRPGSCRERCLDMIISKPGLTEDVEMLSQASEKARVLEPQIQSRLHRQLARALNRVSEPERARAILLRAMVLDEQLGDRQTLLEDWTWWTRTFRHEFRGREDECQHLDKVQDAVQKAWELGRDEGGAWDQGFKTFEDLAWAQHFVNKGRRRLHLPVVHRSGFCSDNESTIFLDYDDTEAAYDQLRLTSPPPWDLSSILDMIKSLL